MFRNFGNDFAKSEINILRKNRMARSWKVARAVVKILKLRVLVHLPCPLDAKGSY